MYRPITIEDIAILFATIVGIISILLYGFYKLLQWLALKSFKGIPNHKEIYDTFKSLKHDIQYAANLTEVSILENAMEDFYYRFDTTKAHNLVERFYTALRTQIIFRRHDLKGERKLKAS